MRRRRAGERQAGDELWEEGDIACVAVWRRFVSVIGQLFSTIAAGEGVLQCCSFAAGRGVAAAAAENWNCAPAKVVSHQLARSSRLTVNYKCSTIN